jgi:protein-tyrosine phosphatase
MKQNINLSELIDLHSHVLYGLDDGSRDFDETITICNKYIENGFNKVVATPHYIKGTKFCSKAEQIIEKVKDLNIVLKSRDMKLQIFTGMEIMLDCDSIEGLRNKSLLTLNNSKYVLVESPAGDFPQYAAELIFQLQGEGYIPVLAHPERNRRIISDIAFAKELFARGVLLQVNKGSVLGHYGKTVQKSSIRLLQEGLVHIIASDTHRTSGRSPSLKNLQSILNKLVGVENTELLMKTNPTAIFENAEVANMKPFKKPMGKITKILSVAAASILVLGMSGFYAFNRAVDYTLEKMFENDVVLNQQISMALGGTDLPKEKVAPITFIDKIEGISRNAINSIFGNNLLGSNIGSSNPSPNTNPIANANQDPTTPVKGENIKADPLDKAVTENNNRVNTSKDERKYESIQPVAISTGKFTSKDRARVVNIIYSSVPSGEIDRLQALTSGGLTSQETAEIKRTLKGYLSAAQIAELKQLYAKYVSSKN